MIASLIMLGICLVIVNKRKVIKIPDPSSTGLLDTLDVSRYRTEAAVDMTIDF
jgi:hypothetical protein